MARRYYCLADGPSVSIRAHIPIISAIVLLFLFIGGCTFGILAFVNHKENVEIEQLWDDVRNQAGGTTYLENTTEQEPISDETSPVLVDIDSKKGYNGLSTTEYSPMDRTFDWDYLNSLNPDIMCWISIPDTPVDYPVLKEQKNGTYYYINHDVTKKSSSAGSLFVPKAPDGYDELDAHLLIFGHNMIRTDIMFNSLLKYEDEAYYLEHPFIYVYYPDRTEQWSVWSTLHIHADNSIYTGSKDKGQTNEVYNLPLEAGTKLYEDVIGYMDSNKYYNAANKPLCNDKILVLSTCDRTDGYGQDGRFLVNAVLKASIVKQ